MLLVATGCEQRSNEMNSKKRPPQMMNKKNTGVYEGEVISKFGSEELHLRLSMGDFRLVISEEIANGRDVADFSGKMISVKGDIDEGDFTVTKWFE